MSGEIRNSDYRFRLSDSLLGAQMLFVAFGALVLVPILTGLDPNVALFTAGGGTLLFQIITKGKVPVFLASSFAFIAPIIHGVNTWGIPGTMCGLVAAGLLWLTVIELAPYVMSGERPEAVSFDIVAGFGIAFKVEPLGMLFGLVASTLWIINSIYSIGYMRSLAEHAQTRYYGMFALAIFSAAAAKSTIGEAIWRPKT